MHNIHTYVHKVLSYYGHSCCFYKQIQANDANTSVHGKKSKYDKNANLSIDTTVASAASPKSTGVTGVTGDLADIYDSYDSYDDPAAAAATTAAATNSPGKSALSKNGKTFTCRAALSCCVG